MYTPPPLEYAKNLSQVTIRVFDVFDDIVGNARVHAFIVEGKAIVRHDMRRGKSVIGPDGVIDIDAMHLADRGQETGGLVRWPCADLTDARTKRNINPAQFMELGRPVDPSLRAVVILVDPTLLPACHYPRFLTSRRWRYLARHTNAASGYVVDNATNEYCRS